MKGGTHRYFEGESLYRFGYDLSYTTFTHSCEPPGKFSRGSVAFGTTEEGRHSLATPSFASECLQLQTAQYRACSGGLQVALAGDPETANVERTESRGRMGK